MSSAVKNHDYHILPPSIWPFVGAVAAFVMFVGGVLWMHDVTPVMFWIGLVGVIVTMFGWWRGVIHESNTGDHTPVVRIGLRYGFILFIISELMFFVAWFWAYFKGAIYPSDMVTSEDYASKLGTFPPAGIEPVDPWGLPLINTLILLLSGATLTWAHHALLENDRKNLIRGLAVTVALGFIFLGMQALEYVHAYHEGLTLQSDLYGAVFFMATGFHGFHVFIGAVFLAVCLVRAMKGDFTPEAHVGFEAAAWYWHFVDVVWLFLFISVYIGSAYFLHAA
ncbi:cytochrome c oxidase subunit 3 [Neomegalonema perideroedes]|uniref:cytochrome c oxidase subunit 3 n=1 Tax=Neomegalonema perideroedes TaxID=217219 RepID=UPI0003716DE8|nr:cytochrome c oxidase subunit 3 [Neomegalonema perideroedes]